MSMRKNDYILIILLLQLPGIPHIQKLSENGRVEVQVHFLLF